MTQTRPSARPRLAILGMLGLLAALSAADAKELGPILSEGFKDDFQHKGLDNRRWYISDGWSNGDWMDCTWSRKAVKLSEGMLRLSHIPDNPSKDEPPLCGEVQTNGFIHYGTIEARIGTPRGPGLNASVFTYAGPVHGVSHDEIDIEILTRSPDEVALNTYVDGKPVNGLTVPVDPPLDRDFHTVALRWEPDSITWYIDGQEVHRTAPDSVLPNHPQKIYMSFWSTTTLTDWMGEQEPRTEPLIYDIDWLAYTPLDQSCLFPESITC
ncbi:family 16 glycosylhydrolase [Paracoccus sp. (in: a-proteobacteria)]|uniref:family 16 glycosylhydrolase n=1 Tax=Paracoccus sp. TaxID=267 RepID=UPI00396D0067